MPNRAHKSNSRRRDNAFLEAGPVLVPFMAPFVRTTPQYTGTDPVVRGMSQEVSVTNSPVGMWTSQIPVPPQLCGGVKSNLAAAFWLLN